MTRVIPGGFVGALGQVFATGELAGAFAGAFAGALAAARVDPVRGFTFLWLTRASAAASL